MKRLGVGSAAAMLFALTAFAQSSLDAQGVATGKAVLWFRGTEVTALIEGDFNVIGTLGLDGRVVPFAAFGTAFGEGSGDSAALTLDVWLIMEAAGTAEDGEPISMRGGMAGSSVDAVLSGSALDSTAGPFFFVVTLGTDSYRAQGTARGRAAGAFVVPDDPLTMQVEGTGTYTLVGDLVPDVLPTEADAGPSADATHLPWSTETWPPDLFARLLALLNGAPRESTGAPEGEPADG